MSLGQFWAPQYGRHSTQPPVSDNPADARRAVPCPQAERAKLAKLRLEFAKLAERGRR